MNILDKLETQQSKQEIPALRAGETVRVHVKVVEGEKERTQVFEGIVIGIGGKGNRATLLSAGKIRKGGPALFRRTVR
jgi:large subunit ribosomal protein L19